MAVDPDTMEYYGHSGILTYDILEHYGPQYSSADEVSQSQSKWLKHTWNPWSPAPAAFEVVPGLHQDAVPLLGVPDGGGDGGVLGRAVQHEASPAPHFETL